MLAHYSFTFHVSRFTFHVSRFTFHVSRFTFHVSRFTFHVSRFTFKRRNTKMQVLVVGGGAREHAIVWKLMTSDGVDAVYCAPGNGGTAMIAQNVAQEISTES